MDRIKAVISDILGVKSQLVSVAPVSGGCINECFKITLASGELYFLKVQSLENIDLFYTEAEGLKALANAGVVGDGLLQVPQVRAVGECHSTAYLLMDFLQLRSLRGQEFSKLGEALAQLHSETKDKFGFNVDNFIGETTQPNGFMSEWVDFYQQQRLSHQLSLATSRGANDTLIEVMETVIAAVPQLLNGYNPKASLLHGDLWSGNAACCIDGTPAIFDPAVYYGDRETDIAMTELFGGFTRDFYQGYNAVWRLDTGYERRKPLYQLYHSLNHFNLFGGSYQQQAIGHGREALSFLE